MYNTLVVCLGLSDRTRLLYNHHTPWMRRNGASLDTHELFPDRPRHRTHTVWPSGDVDVFTQIANPVYRADDGRST